jgi:tRNA A-37 threonylcarbamoyl transferase component Bud32
VKRGCFYRADLITVLLPDTHPLSGSIGAAGVDPAIWPRIGAMLARFHAAQIDHPDLTAHNILLDSVGRPYLLDFDNARRRPGDGWKAARVARLHRSLNKVALETGTFFDPQGWEALLAAYSAR